MDNHTNPRVQLQQQRLRAAVAHLEEKHKDCVSLLEYVAEKSKRVEDYISAYEEGKPFFARDMMASLAKQLDELQQPGAPEREDGGTVTLKNVVGIERSWPLVYSGYYVDECDTFFMHYLAIQHLTYVSIKFPDKLLEVGTPVCLCWGKAATPSGWLLSDLEAAFRAHQSSWQQSAACQSLIKIIEESAANFPAPIRKVVCFGLGRLDAREKKTTREELAESVRHSATQHAAAITMAEALARAQGGGIEVRCYAQDPAYAAVEKQLLAALGFTVLEDPKGFLEVDESTLVFTVYPDVPVRQIVTDMGWPAAMVWKTIEADCDEQHGRDYKIETRDGGEVHRSPWTTDEGSTRVIEMGRHYDSYPFPGSPEQGIFGDSSIYFRKKE